MRPLLIGVYVFMSAWLIAAAGRRIAMLLADGTPLDWSPFASGGIGLLALLLLITTYDRGRDHQ